MNEAEAIDKVCRIRPSLSWVVGMSEEWTAEIPRRF